MALLPNPADVVLQVELVADVFSQHEVRATELAVKLAEAWYDRGCKRLYPRMASLSTSSQHDLSREQPGGLYERQLSLHQGMVAKERQ